MFPKSHVLGMNNYLWNRDCGLGSKSWRGCEINKNKLKFTNAHNEPI